MTNLSKKRSANFMKAELIITGNGCLLNRSEHFSIASHCSPRFDDRSPILW